jgi:uncharacterized membrane protein
MSTTSVQLLRVLHVLGGAVWLGTVLFLVVYLLPTLKAIGPTSGQVMAQMVDRKFPIYMMVIPIITVLSGLGLYWVDSAGFSGQWSRSGPGMTFSFGATCAIIVVILGMSVNAPAGKKLGDLGAVVRARGGPPTPEEQGEMARLQNKLTRATQAAAVLLILAGGAMAVARYVP